MDANNLKKAFELFVKLQDKKVKLSNVDGKIKYRAPSGIMTNEVIEEIRKCKNELLTIINCTEHPEKLWKGKQGDSFATVYKGNIIKNLIMDCQSYTKYRPNETMGGIFVSWRRKEELPTGA